MDVTIKETMDVIAKLKNWKAPGLDGITKKALKSFPQRTILYLILLLNGPLKVGHFPKASKKENVVMLHKKGKKFILDGFQRKECVVAAYLDIQPVFDTVLHQGLLYKLKSGCSAALLANR